MLPMLAMLLLGAALCGCAALTNPVAKGVPVRCVPPELLAEPKQGKEPLPLLYLRQRPPEVYLLGPGDVLGVYIEGVLGEASQPLPVHVSDFANVAPSIGYPIPISDDGTLSLPLVRPIRIQGMTIMQAQRAVVDAYTVGQQILRPGQERIMLTLIRPRQTRVQVLRQDTPVGSRTATLKNNGIVIGARSYGLGAEQLVGGTGHGMGTTIDLPAYENDVLNALAQTGGMPGLDAANEVIIQRGYLQSPEDLARQIASGERPDFGASGFTPTMLGGEIIRIPLRLPPGQPLPFRPEDVILHNGDIVYIEARDAEVFYTSGLIPPGEFPLPRDYDLDVVKAIAMVGGPMVNGAVNVNNLTGSLVQAGLGTPSPRLVSVLRRTPCGGQIVIIVDLNRALRDPCENLLVKPGDVLVMQESKCQATARYFSQVFQFDIFSKVINTSATTATTSLAVP
jgi:hypothetical protein